MKAKIPFERRNPKGAAASKAEILRQIVETSKDYELETDALFLWTPHVSPKYRLGLGRLRELYEEVFQLRKEIHDFYRAKPEENPQCDTRELENENKQMTYFVFKHKLKEYGLDIDAEYNRLDDKYKLK